jgi:predicted amidohydrolase
MYDDSDHSEQPYIMKKIITSMCLALFSQLIIFAQDEPRVAGEPSETQVKKIRIASCQFPVSSDIMGNLGWIEKQMTYAKLRKADMIHFPECALSGYPGVDMDRLDDVDWDLLKQATDSVLVLARTFKIWVVLGSMHPLSEGHKPHNCLYLINPEGEIVDRYDKRFCTGSDLEFFTPGDHFVNFQVNGVKCGLLICFDIRFPELYREYRKTGTDIIFQSFYNARQGKGSIHPVIMPVTARARAATNYFYISTTNSSAPQSWPCYFITPDGLVRNTLEKNVPGVLISDADLSEEFYDASRAFRPDAMNGKLHSGETVPDPLSKNRHGY